MSINIVEYLETLKKNDVASYKDTITKLKEYLQNVEEEILTKKYIDYLIEKIKKVYVDKIDRNSECILDMERVDSIITDNIKNNIIYKPAIMDNNIGLNTVNLNAVIQKICTLID